MVNRLRIHVCPQEHNHVLKPPLKHKIKAWVFISNPRAPLWSQNIIKVFVCHTSFIYSRWGLECTYWLEIWTCLWQGASNDLDASFTIGASLSPSTLMNSQLLGIYSGSTAGAEDVLSIYSGSNGAFGVGTRLWDREEGVI